MSLKKLFQIISSIKLSIILFSMIVILGLLSTLIRQEELAEYDSEKYGSLSNFIAALGLNNFWTSKIFFTVVFLFLINLGSCTIFRFIKVLKAKNSHFGPDILHLGLLMLVIILIVSFFDKEQKIGTGSAWLNLNNFITLPNNNILKLKDYELKYSDNGRPQSEIAYFDLIKDSKIVLENHPISVNNPLNIGLISVNLLSIALDKNKNPSFGITVTNDKYFYLILSSMFISFLGLVISVIFKIRNKK